MNRRTKRKRTMDDTGDRDSKKMDLGDHKFGMDELHLDVGPKYLFCQTRKAPLTALFSHSHEAARDLDSGGIVDVIEKVLLNIV